MHQCLVSNTDSKCAQSKISPHLQAGYYSCGPKQPQVMATQRSLKSLDLGLLSVFLNDLGQDISLTCNFHCTDKGTEMQEMIQRTFQLSSSSVSRPSGVVRKRSSFYPVNINLAEVYF